MIGPFAKPSPFKPTRHAPMSPSCADGPRPQGGSTGEALSSAGA